MSAGKQSNSVEKPPKIRGLVKRCRSFKEDIMSRLARSRKEDRGASPTWTNDPPADIPLGHRIKEAYLTLQFVESLIRKNCIDLLGGSSNLMLDLIGALLTDLKKSSASDSVAYQSAISHVKAALSEFLTAVDVLLLKEKADDAQREIYFEKVLDTLKPTREALTKLKNLIEAKENGHSQVKTYSLPGQPLLSSTPKKPPRGQSQTRVPEETKKEEKRPPLPPKLKHWGAKSFDLGYASPPSSSTDFSTPPEKPPKLKQQARVAAQQLQQQQQQQQQQQLHVHNHPDQRNLPPQRGDDSLLSQWLEDSHAGHAGQTRHSRGSQSSQNLEGSLHGNESSSSRSSTVWTDSSIYTPSGKVKKQRNFSDSCSYGPPQLRGIGSQESIPCEFGECQSQSLSLGSSLDNLLLVDSSSPNSSHRLNEDVFEEEPPQIPAKSRHFLLAQQERSPSPYDNVDDVRHSYTYNMVYSESGQTLVDFDKPPPIPPKKKHSLIAAYVEFFANNTQTTEGSFHHHHFQNHNFVSMGGMEGRPRQSYSYHHFASFSAGSSSVFPEESSPEELPYAPLHNPPPALPPKKKRSGIRQSISEVGHMSSFPPHDFHYPTQSSHYSHISPSPSSHEETSVVPISIPTPPPTFPPSPTREPSPPSPPPIDETEMELMVLDVSAELVMTGTGGKDGPEVKGGDPLTLLIYAASPTLTDPKFKEVFILTYRNFLRPLDVVALLWRRFEYLEKRTSERNNVVHSRATLDLYVDVVNSLTPMDLDDEMIGKVRESIYHLVNTGELLAALKARKGIIVKYEVRTKLLSPKPTPVSLAITVEAQSLLQWSASSIAQQMTLLDSELFRQLEPAELLLWAREQLEDACPALNNFTEHFNKVSYWARSRVLLCGNSRERNRTMKKLIEVMRKLREYGNFNSLLAVLAALDSAPIRRLGFSRRLTEALKPHAALTDSSGSFRNYRQALSETKTPCIPYIGLVLQDLTFVHIGNADFLQDGKVNWVKRWQQWLVLEPIRRFHSCHYNFVRNESLLAFLNNFDESLNDDELWQLSESIKPRGKN